MRSGHKRNDRLAEGDRGSLSRARLPAWSLAGETSSDFPPTENMKDHRKGERTRTPWIDSRSALAALGNETREGRNDRFWRRVLQEDLPHAQFLKLNDVLVRHNAASNDDHVVGPLGSQKLKDF